MQKFQPSKLFFGTAGVPISSDPHTTIDGIKRVAQLGLGAMELEFVHSVNISSEKSPSVKQAAKENNVILSCHGQYFINLSSLDNAKKTASRQRVLNAARIANECGAWSMTFHAGFYQGRGKDEVYNIIKDEISEITKQLKSEGNEIWVRPETTGKDTQFGNVDEILNLSSELDNVMPCIDFAHFHARANGKYNTYEEFAGILETVEKRLGRRGLDNVHAHMTGIAYGPKGEKNHLVLRESDMNYIDLMKCLKDFKVKGIVICESPNIEEDAMLMKKTYEKF